MGRKIENASQGITLQIEKKAEIAGALNTHIYLIMDAQLNIQSKAFVSNICQESADDARTSNNTVCGSDEGWKTHLALDLMEQEYLNYFKFIIILCPTL